MSRWNSAEFTEELRHVTWMAAVPVLMYLNERATGDPAREWMTGWARRYFVGDRLRVLVLGCGEGWLERMIAGWPFVASIDAVDAAEEAVERARLQGGPNIRYRVADLNTARLEENAYDVVIAHSILHHLDNLEHAFDQIVAAMRPDATFLVNEYAGPNRFQYSDDVLWIINELLSCLPRELRRGVVEQRVYDRRERPSIETMIATDPTEAVRAEDVLPMVRDRFDVLEQKTLGGTVLMHLLYDIAQNFRWEHPHERGYLEMMCAFEGALVDTGAIGSDFVALAARKRSSRLSLTAYQRPLPPRPDAANDVEADPLGFGRRTPVAHFTGGAGLTFEPWMLRVLRILLVSTRERRANLVAVSRLRSAVERMRHSVSGLSPFQWMRSRWSAAADDDPAMSRLLDAFERIWTRLR